MDPYERADIVSDQYNDWMVKNAYLIGELSFHAVLFLETFKEYPPSQLPASFSVDGVEGELDSKIQQTLKPPAPVALPNQKK
jgi:arylsulfatase